MENISTDLQRRFMTVEENLKRIDERMAQAAQKSGRKAQDITLLAATKTVPAQVVNHAIACGIRCIGENRVQELLSKYDALNLSACDCHFIGSLQTNKVKQIITKVTMIHSEDRVKLAQEINRCAEKLNRKMDILIEVNIGCEKNKSGVLADEIYPLLEEVAKMRYLSVRGLMAIPPVCNDSDTIRQYFSKMRELFIDIGAKKIDNVTMDFLSMGMSSDYYEAILEGANIVRIGSSLFGARIYP